MPGRKVHLVLLTTSSDLVILRVDFEGDASFRAYIYQDRARLETLLQMTGLPFALSRDDPANFIEVADFQLRDLLDYSDGPHLCKTDDCDCARHQAA